MALFSRRKKSDDAAEAVEETPQEAVSTADTVEPEQSERAPAVNISVQSFRGVGAAAGPVVEPPSTEPAAAQPTPAPAAADGMPPLPFAPANPPAQTESVPGMQDNVLLRETLARLEEGPTNEQLLGVLRQMMQGHLYLRVQGDARQLIAEGKPLSVGTVSDGENTYLMVFSSAVAVQKSLAADGAAQSSSAIAQPVSAVLTQVKDGPFTGIIIDTASAPQRAVFPREILEKAWEQADPQLAIKGLLAQPRTEEAAQQVAELLATTPLWVAVNSPEGSEQVGIAEARMADGRRFLQVYTHPLEVVALGRGDRPMPFTPEQLGSVFLGNEELAGIVIDPAGPTLVLERPGLTAAVRVAMEAKSDGTAPGTES